MTDIPKLVKSGKDLKDFNYNHLKPSAFNLMKMPFLKQETELKESFPTYSFPKYFLWFQLLNKR